MTRNTVTEESQQLFPFLKAPRNSQLLAAFNTSAKTGSVPAGEVLLWEGGQCTQLAIILSGSVRVYKSGENGREITLYRIAPGEGCILSVSCILSQQRFPALAQVEADARAVMIPAPALRQWLKEYEDWRDYICDLLARRLSDIISTVEEVAFHRVDSRIAQYLLDKAQGGATIATTHQQVASELGTAREVASRILKELERQGCLSLSRGKVTIENRTVLESTAKRR
jgi:CRP/FNR family transcriptional regulator